MKWAAKRCVCKQYAMWSNCFVFSYFCTATALFYASVYSTHTSIVASASPKPEYMTCWIYFLLLLCCNSLSKCFLTTSQLFWSIIKCVCCVHTCLRRDDAPEFNLNHLHMGEHQDNICQGVLGGLCGSWTHSMRVIVTHSCVYLFTLSFSMQTFFPRRRNPELARTCAHMVCVYICQWAFCESFTLQSHMADGYVTKSSVSFQSVSVSFFPHISS